MTHQLGWQSVAIAVEVPIYVMENGHGDGSVSNGGALSQGKKHKGCLHFEE
jgi:hypothetical protein